MGYTSNISFKEFRERVEDSWREDYDEQEYRRRVGKVLQTARGALFSKKKHELEKTTLWSEWILRPPMDEEIYANRVQLSKFGEGIINDLSQGRPATIHALVAHYQLHRYHKYEDLKFARTIDKGLFKNRPLRPNGKLVFHYEPDAYNTLRPNAPFEPPHYLRPEDVKGGLDWLSPHNHHSIPFQKRPEIVSRLDKFMEYSSSFRVCPVIAPSGAGKTRLISEWMKKYVLTDEQNEWEAGFVVSSRRGARDPEPWHEDNWEITRNTLIVIDYTYAFDEVLRAIVETATHQKSENPYLVRLIVIDHTMPEMLRGDFRWGEIAGGRPAQLRGFNDRYLEEKIEIVAEKDKSELLHGVISNSASLGERDFGLDHPLVNEALVQLDRIGAEQNDKDTVRHPLFAALMGQAIRTSEHGDIDFSVWTRRDLIEYYFEGADRLPWTGWKKHPETQSKTEQGLLVGALISAATLRRGLPIVDAQDFLPTNHDELIQRANSFVSSMDEDRVQEFLPDILGEIFLLKFLQAVESNAKIARIFISILQSSDDKTATAQNFRETVARLARNLANDDQSSRDVAKSWEILCHFLRPEQFDATTAIRPNVSYAIADVLEQLFRILDTQHRCDLGSSKSEFNAQKNANLVKFHEHCCSVLIDQFNISDVKKTCESSEFHIATRAGFKFFDVLDEKTFQTLRHNLASIARTFVSRDKKQWSALFLAAYEGRKRIIQPIIQMLSEDVNGPSEDGWTALIAASQNGHLEVVKCLHTEGADLNVTGNNGWTAMMAASRNGHIEVIDYLRAEGANLNAVAINGATMVIIASETGCLEVVKYFYAEGADLNAVAKNGVTAVLIASQNGHLEVAKYLCKEGADLNAADNDGLTALILASQNGHLEVVEYLHANGADLDAVANDGLTAVMSASQNEHIEVVKYLCGEGADFNAALNDGTTALILASQNGHLEVAQYLCKEGADLNAADNDGRTALILASRNGHIEVIEYLQAEGADINVTSSNGATALIAASENGNLQAVKYSYAEGANLNAVAKNGGTAVLVASQNGHLEVVKYLCKEGADLNAADNDGRTALILASRNGHIEVIEYLQAEGADINATSSNGATALMAASQNGHIEVVTYLCGKGADINAALRDGRTAVMVATLNGHLEVVKCLHAKGADLNATSSNGATVLMAASQTGHIEVVKYLCGKGADLNATTDIGVTAAILACQNGHLEVVKYLHVEGADLNAVANGGLTAAMVASENDHMNIVEFLKDKDVELNAETLGQQ